MAKRKKTISKSKGNRYDETQTTQKTDQSGVRLEQFCEEREVGMDGVTHWKDAALEEADIYNFMGWFELDGYPLNKRLTMPDLKSGNVISSGKFDPFQYLFKIMKVDETHLSLGSIYESTGNFRYEESGEGTQSTNELNFAFDDTANVGFSARSIQF